MLKHEIKNLIWNYILYTNEQKVFKHHIKSHVKRKLKLQQVDNVVDEAIHELKKENVIAVSRNKMIVIRNRNKLFKGKFRASPKGFGFVTDEKTNETVFIPPNHHYGAFHNDIVVCKIMEAASDDRKAVGKIVSVLERRTNRIVGTYIQANDGGFVIPDDEELFEDIYIPSEKRNGANSYDKVVCVIDEYPKRNRRAEGEIQEVIGLKWEKGVDKASILKKYGIEGEFPRKVIRQAELLPKDISDEERKRRADLTELFLFTIDGADSKDLDDAVSIEQLDNGHFLLGVHIADVAHYVRERSKLDVEARKRGVSVYLVDDVIPMLPKQLSNDLCSLNPMEEKLSISVFMEVNHSGNVVNKEIKESIIVSKARLTYEAVSRFIVGESVPEIEQNEELVSRINLLINLTTLLSRKRDERGSLRFDFDEPKAIVDEYGEVIDVVKEERTIAHSIIEECMLLCNETIAKFVIDKQIPFLFRVHEKPKTDQLEYLQDFLEVHHYPLLDLEKITSKNLQSLLKYFSDKNEKEAVHTILLRSMLQARYSSLPLGHFGLATKNYSHFTSPIRRYPDLVNQRIIKAYLNRELNEKRKETITPLVERVAYEATAQKLDAEKAENEYRLNKITHFMVDKIGETYEGVVTGLTRGFIFVMLPNAVEGRIPIAYVKEDDYIFDEKRLEWRGKETNNIIELGDWMTVTIKDVDVESKTIVFEPIYHRSKNKETVC